jgi:RNA polymerase sigma-70 factor, ECF subfamily
MSRLIRLWKNVSPAASFEGCLRTHLDRLWRVALRLQGNPADAEDLMQELLGRAWEQRQQVLTLDEPGSWLARVLYRLHVDRWRRRGLLGDALALDADDAPQPQLPAAEAGDALLAAVDADAVLRAVQRLPEAQRVVLLLADGEGYSLEEISELVEAPLGTVKSRLHRARMDIRMQFAEGAAATTLVACAGGEGK